LKFQGGKIVTADSANNDETQIALRGIIGSMFLKDLGAKTHRGQEGRVLNGKSAGGRSYGYRIDRQPLPDGTWTTGDLLINEDEATVIKRIFRDYDEGQSGRAIAIALNREGVPAPSSGKGSGEWTFSTIQGFWQRGTGILNNELYVGMRVWNRQHFVTHPETGKRQARLNPPEEWTRNAVPELRIIDDDLWSRVKDRQSSIRWQRHHEQGAHWQRAQHLPPRQVSVFRIVEVWLLRQLIYIDEQNQIRLRCRPQ
jgi:site-specific DNA recombinase